MAALGVKITIFVLLLSPASGRTGNSTDEQDDENDDNEG